MLAAKPASKKAKKAVYANFIHSAIMPFPQPSPAPDFPHKGVLDGVSFTEGASDLSLTSKQRLQPLIDELIAQSDVRIAVMAHTDNRGPAVANEHLSIARANAVVEHLVGNGVSANRLTSEGYGETLPLVQNVTAKDRQRNRRVEIRVLGADL